MTQSATSAHVCSTKPAAVDHSATRCRERRLLTNARIEWMAAIRYAATAASSKDRIGNTVGAVIVSDPRLSANICGLCALESLAVQSSMSKRGVGHPAFGSGTSSARFLREPGDREKR